MEVFQPSTQAELLSTLSRLLPTTERPGRATPVLFAGGTHVMSHPEAYRTGPPIICLRGVESLSRITRTQRHLDIGATATLSRILSIGPNVIPESLFAAIKTVGTPTVRALASLGGNLCSPAGEHTTHAPLCALGAQFELRSPTGSRWIPAATHTGESGCLVAPSGEILTRVRLPLVEYSAEVYRREEIRTDGSRTYVHFCGVARVRQGVVQEVRVALATSAHGTFRSRELEARCAGVGLPVPARTRNDLREVLDVALGRFLDGPSPVDDDTRRRVELTRDLGVRLWVWFLAGLREGGGDRPSEFRSPVRRIP